MSCVKITDRIREFASHFEQETPETIANALGLWWEANPNRAEEMPMVTEFGEFLYKELRGMDSSSSRTQWARTANDSYEVSSQGDKRFSALYATFKQGTIIDGVDVSGMTIENVYQKVIKKSGKGKAPGKESRLNVENPENTNTTFRSFPNGVTNVIYGANDAYPRVQFTAPNGEKGLIEWNSKRDYWSVASYDKNSETFHTEFLSKEEIDRIVHRFLPDKFREFKESGEFDKLIELDTKEDETKPRNLREYPSQKWLRDNYNIHYINEYFMKESVHYVNEHLKEGTLNNEVTGKHESFEDFSYYEGYLPLWQEWARQNPELIKELREKSRGKTLTDKFASTRVSQARALADILNDTTEALDMLDNALYPELGTESDSGPFATLPIATLAEQRAVDLIFDPRVRRDRVTLISRLFSNEVDSALKERQDTINRRMMEEQLTDKDRDDLRKELYSLDRFQMIRTLTPGGVFNRVRAAFEAYVNDSEEGRVQAELNKINATEQSLIDAGEIEESERFSDEDKLAAAKRKAAYKFQEYQKLVDHFRPLAEEASGLLLTTEGIRVDPNYASPKDANLNEDDPEGNSEVGNSADDGGKEESYKDGWMTNFRQVSSHESLSQAVRKVIREIPSLDYEGMIEEDDLGNIRYLDADYVHATLIDKLRNMITSEDMIPLLEDLAEPKPWVEQIAEAVSNDDTLFSQFYQDFRKDYVQYWIQKKVSNPDGTFKIETISINKPEGVYYLLDSWRDNYESGTILDTDSVYEKNGEINRENAAKGLTLVEQLNNKFQNLDTQERLNLLENEDTWNGIVKLLNMIGIDPNPAILRTALTDIKSTEQVKYTDPIMLLLPQLNVIFSGIRKGQVKSETAEDDTVKRGDLINTFSSAYNEIASMLAEVTEDAIESSVRENEKTYYSHVTPSYLGKLIKQLKNVRNDPQKFQEFLQTEFKQYEWFFKNGRWRSDWLEKLSTDPAMRNALQHKVVLNHAKIEYSDWDDLDYTIVLLNEYWAEPKEKMAWYHVSILSDSPSAEFIRFVRYTNGSEIDEEGNRRTFQDIILDKMVDIVNQEYDRIMLVRERDERFLNGESISPIANFDIKRDSKGNIKSLGGAEFKFIPELNSIVYDNGETFLDRFERLKSSPSQFREFVRNTLNTIMEEGFEATYAEWANIGLLDELPNGRFKNIPFQGQSVQNQKVAKALKEAQKALGNMFTTDMLSLLQKYTNNKVINDNQANEIFDQIRDILNDKVTRGEMSVTDMNSITRNLTTKNNAKDALREYYWNSKFATSQIIELTTTDLAFYKDLEDFQKRYKEVHAPSLRLNTMAKFHGETIGRTWERTIYLADDEIVSTTIKDIEDILNAKVEKGEMTKVEKDYILSQFEKVNVADAQAYRSLGSYRAMMGMMGQWTDDMETAYKHLTDPNGEWTMQDFNIILQIKKPYVYTQINNDSGVEGHTGIKTPVQHKNSEFLLLALYQTIGGNLHKSGKLRAINEFMEKNQIDVVQFESTTKVGKI